MMSCVKSKQAVPGLISFESKTAGCNVFSDYFGCIESQVMKQLSKSLYRAHRTHYLSDSIDLGRIVASYLGLKYENFPYCSLCAKLIFANSAKQLQNKISSALIRHTKSMRKERVFFFSSE